MTKITLILFLLFMGCYNTNSGIVVNENKGFISFNCKGINNFTVEINNDIKFDIIEKDCNKLYQISSGKNKIKILKNNKIILLREIFISNSETLIIDL